MSSFAFLESGPGNPAMNMALDEAMLRCCASLGFPILRLYAWTEPAATFGYFQKYEQVELLTPLRPLIRRPTGGGIVPHDRDWTYCLAFPPQHEWHSVTAVESYRRVHAWLQAAFAELGVQTELAPSALPGAGQCFIGYERHDLLYRGCKIAGAAQRRNRDGLLIQGSVQPPDQVSALRQPWHEAMRATGQKIWCADWESLSSDAGEQIHKFASDLCLQKYSQTAYNRKR